MTDLRSDIESTRDVLHALQLQEGYACENHVHSYKGWMVSHHSNDEGEAFFVYNPEGKPSDVNVLAEIVATIKD